MTGTGSTTFAATATVNIAPTATSGNATTDTRTVTNNGTVNLTEVSSGGQLVISNGNTCKLYHAVYFGVMNHVDFGWNVVDPDPNHTGVAGCRAIQFHTTDNSGLDDSDRRQADPAGERHVAVTAKN